MKKTVAAILIAILCSVGGAAFAKEGKPAKADQKKVESRETGAQERRAKRPKKPMNEDSVVLKNAPEEIRAKAAQLEKLRGELRDLLGQKPLDRAQALETFDKIEVLRNEIGKWMFEQRLDRIEQRQQEKASGDKTSGTQKP